MSNLLKEAVEITKRQIKIVYIKQSRSESIPSGGIKFDELIDTRGLFDLINKLFLIHSLCVFLKDLI